MNGREPPANLSAERDVLGSILLKPAVIDQVRPVLLPEDFYLDAHRSIYEGMLDLSGRSINIDLTTLADCLRSRGTLLRLHDGEHYLLKLSADVPTAENVDHYVNIVVEKSRQRRMISLFAEYLPRLYNPTETTVDDLFASIETDVMTALTPRSRAETLAVAVTETIELIIARGESAGDLLGVPSGIRQLDRLTDGHQPGHLIIVGARPGVGKTSWVVGNCAVHAALDLGIPTIIFSLEMSRVELLMRTIASRTRIPGERLKRGALTPEEFRDGLYPAATELSRAPLEIHDRGIKSIANITAKIRHFRRNERYFPPSAENADKPPRGLIIVDYLQLVAGSGTKHQQSREQEIAEVSAALKQVAKDTGLPVIAASQLNRGLEKREDKRPQLSDLRESGSIEQDADIVMFLHRPDMHASGGELRVQGRAELLVRKNRHGPTGVAFASWLPDLQRFEPWHGDESFDE